MTNSSRLFFTCLQDSLSGAMTKVATETQLENTELLRLVPKHPNQQQYWHRHRNQLHLILARLQHKLTVNWQSFER
ncbi:hypothetical protein Q5P01_004069 [Channa striata]|uniref:Uncharacterized protein n=1 Tax=Channa striata TaxID=64152 RepID=A0AA88NI36_CHASR|nr:hypothetical protein Q5P01_004069 [Channa striata]